MSITKNKKEFLDFIKARNCFRNYEDEWFFNASFIVGGFSQRQLEWALEELDRLNKELQ